jgi:hypothetical protein
LWRSVLAASLSLAVRARRRGFRRISLVARTRSAYGYRCIRGNTGANVRFGAGLSNRSTSAAGRVRESTGQKSRRSGRGHHGLGARLAANVSNTFGSGPSRGTAPHARMAVVRPRPGVRGSKLKDRTRWRLCENVLRLGGRRLTRPTTRWREPASTLRRSRHAWLWRARKARVVTHQPASSPSSFSLCPGSRSCA